MGKCALCDKVTYAKGHLFAVPNDEQKRQQWSDECGVVLEAKSFVCGDHFLQTDVRVGAKRVHLMPRAVPLNPLTSRAARKELLSRSKAKAGVKPPRAAVHTEDPLSWQDTPNDSREEVKVSNYVEPLLSLVPEDIRIAPTTVDCSTQTDNDYFLSNIELDNIELRKQMRKLYNTNSTLSKKAHEATKIMKTLESVFTQSEIKQMLRSENK